MKRKSGGRVTRSSRTAYNPSMRTVLLFLLALSASAQDVTVLKPARVFDGETSHEAWAVRVRGDRIEAAGPAASIDTANAKVVDLPGATLLPGLVEGHSHILLHPYNETPWNDQVAHEGLALRVARAVNHLRATLMAGFTTVRDLGTEGAALRRCRTQAGGQSGHHPRSADPRLDARHRGHRQLRAQRIRARMARAAGRRRGRRHRQPDARGARPDRPRRRLDQALRRLSLGRRARRAPHLFARRNEARGRDRQERRRSRRRAHQHARRNAPRRPGRRGDHRARRRRHARNLQAHGWSITSRCVPRWPPATPPRSMPAGRRDSSPSPAAFSASGPASRPPWKPA